MSCWVSCCWHWILTYHLHASADTKNRSQKSDSPDQAMIFPIHQPDLVSLCLWLLLLADRTATQCGLLLVPISRKGRACCASQITHSKECTTHQQSPSEPAQTVHIWLVYWFASQYGSMFQYSAFIFSEVFLFPPGRQLHIQHPLSNISTKPSQPFLSNLVSKLLNLSFSTSLA